jgi:translation initiation factor 2B subunit (eIF-2B alpha/beta/delta family)
MLTIDDISTKLSKGELAVFIGAGVSRSYGNQQGIPSASDLLNIFASKFPYIKNDSSYIKGELRFENACLMIKENNGERELISAIMKEINKPSIRPLPAHNILAKLPFSSYFSTNWDTLLETACTNVNGNYPVIYEDEHVAMLKNGDIPIVKLHGCICNPKSIVASIDDYKPFKKTKPLIDAITKVDLASKTILFLGYNLNDLDFKILYNDLYRVLGKKFMGKHMAVVLNPTQSEIDKWDKNGITITNNDLTDFLNDLALKFRGSCNDFGGCSVKSTYLKELHNVTDCPTETIATNVFLNMLTKEVSLGLLSVEQIVFDFETGYKAVLEKKPNFSAFENECREILNALNNCNNSNEMLNYLEMKVNELNVSSIEINKHNGEVIKRSDSILMYSQSIRVTNLLKSFTRDYQQSCTLYISECRPKCPSPFYDAIQIQKSLEDTGYKKHIVTDTSITYLMKKHQITQVIMGAHAVYMKDGKMIKFVNTSGSDMILREAKNFKIPVFIIAEKKKCKPWVDSEESNIGYIEEKLITKSLGDEGIDTFEVAYDLCDTHEYVSFVCEDGVIK